MLGRSEITKSLKTSDRAEAAERSYVLAARALALFRRAKVEMGKKTTDDPLFAYYGFAIDLDDLGKPKKVTVTDVKPGEEAAVNSTVSNALESIGALIRKNQPNEVQIQAAEPVAANGHRFDDLMDEYRKFRRIAPATFEIYRTAANRFEGRHPGLVIEQVTRQVIADYISWMSDEQLSSKTIQKEHGALRALFGFAKSRFHWIADNPASEAELPRIKAGESQQRRFSSDELNAIFRSPVFADGERPPRGKGEAAFWVPLLLLFTGARREEICQLTVGDVRNEGECAYLSIDPAEEGRVKTAASRRKVPIHRELVRIGFLRYVQSLGAKPGKRLFEEMKPNKREQVGAKWGDWWSRYLRQTVGIKDKKVSPAHSFRHTMITECRRLNMRPDYERTMVGHVAGARGPDAHDSYGEIEVSALANELNRIEYPGLDLTHLHWPHASAKSNS